LGVRTLGVDLTFVEISDFRRSSDRQKGRSDLLKRIRIAEEDQVFAKEDSEDEDISRARE